MHAVISMEYVRLNLERGVVWGGKLTEELGPLASDWLRVVLTDGAFPLLVTGGSDVGDHAALMTGLHVFLDPDHNGQLLPAGRKLQPLRNVAVIIFPSSYKIGEDISTCKQLQNHCS